MERSARVIRPPETLPLVRFRWLPGRGSILWRTSHV